MEGDPIDKRDMNSHNYNCKEVNLNGKQRKR